ncbi:carboxypeptidase regulatory-like domain-containing protein [Clostridium sp.]|uniref:carboxypeptidase regulatory-like domain-containing protein n=1 Tax=Clostridium sp. TaxID=1506 RepID=UPI002631B572|nr:carboxypeptidase regulatory-like domain-containing protein [Clostridium sp.]
MKKIIKLNKRFISFFLAVMLIYSMAFTGVKVSATTTTGLTISVNDSSNQSIPQYTNNGGSRMDTIFNSSNSVRNTPVRLAANATAKISYNFTNATLAKYQFVSASDVTTPPQFPQDSTMTDINLPAPNSKDAYANDIGDQGTISTMQYVYAGNPSSASSSAQLTRDVSFGTPLSSTMLVQNATVGSDIPNYTVSGSNAFLSNQTMYIDKTTSKTTKDSTYYVWNPFSNAYSKPTKNAAWKAMKYWGYFSPSQSGYYNLGAYSDDGAYGYIIVNGQTKEFVNDWSINAAFNRTDKNPVYLSANSYYPIYMEWYEGCPTQGAFTPVYQFSSQSSTSALNSSWSNVPQNYFYSSKTTTPGTIPGAYFGDVSGIPFPTQDGIYYIATKFLSDNGATTTSGLYGPFIIDNTPPTITSLSVVSDYSGNNKKAGGGNTLTITFKASEPLQANPQILIDGYVASVVSYTKDSNDNYTATVKIGSDGSINSSGDKITQTGSIIVKIANYSDLSGNVGLPVQDSSVTVINVTGINLTLTQNPTEMINGNVTITANASASGSQNSIKTIKWAAGSQSVNYFTAGGTSIYDSSISGDKSTAQSTFNVYTNGVYTVYATDSTGNVAVQTIDVENIFIAKPVITSPTTGTVTNNNTPTITGTAEANSTVKVYDGATLIGTVNADGSGNWTLTPTTGLSDGAHTITATATSATGNVSSPSDAVNITIDKTPPVLTLSQSSTASTNGTVTITAETTDGGSGVASITNVTATDGKPQGTATNPTNSVINANNGMVTNSDGTLISDSTITYTVNANGTYEFTAKDNAGNTTTQSIDINNITATVQGTVTDATTHNPISGVTVSVVLDGGATVSTKTDSNGEYTLSNITAPASGVRVTITASANDYSTESSTQTLVGKVDAYTQNFSLNPYNLPSISLSQSPDAGTYTNGVVTITATGAAGTNPVKDIILPNGTSISGVSAQYEVTSNGVYTFTVEDTEGKRAQATITINNIYATVQGTVRDSANNNPINGATVTVKNTNGDTLFSMLTGSDGKYTFNSINAPAAGVQVIITASANDYSTQSFTQTLVGKVTPYGQDFALTNTYAASIISAHGLYNGSITNIINNGTASVGVTNGIPVTMAMIVDARSSHPVINLSADNNTNITIDNTSFKGYDISAGTIGSPTSLSIDGSGNITGLSMQNGNRYLIVYTITPMGSDNVTLTAKADSTSPVPVTLNIEAQPDLF